MKQSDLDIHVNIWSFANADPYFIIIKRSSVAYYNSLVLEKVIFNVFPKLFFVKLWSSFWAQYFPWNLDLPLYNLHNLKIAFIVILQIEAYYFFRLIFFSIPLNSYVELWNDFWGLHNIPGVMVWPFRIKKGIIK